MIEFMVAIEVNRHQNIGTIIRCAVAFGVKYLIVVGSSKFGTHGAHGSQNHINIKHVYSWKSFMEYISSLGDFEICGILSKKNIVKSSSSSSSSSFSNQIESLEYENKVASIDSKRFTKSCVFLLSNNMKNGSNTSSNQNMDGFTTEQRNLCDSLVYISTPCPFDKYIKYESKILICFYKFTSQFPQSYIEKSFHKEKYDILDSIHHSSGLKIENVDQISSMDLSYPNEDDVISEELNLLFGGNSDEID